MLSATSVLALFTLLALSAAIFFAAKRFKIPYTILLVLAGLLLVPIVQIPFLEPVFGFLDDLQLTPELLFYIFLPVLIFESAFNMNIRKMLESAWTITLLAVVGLLISTLLIATALYWLLPLIGFDIPFIIALLFGAIISSTDPVAVLALFKEFGAPKRLTMIFEGESLFNDGTAVALFLVLLAVAGSGFNGFETVADGVLMFVGMVVFGILLGLVMAIVFSRALRFTRSNEFVTVTLLIISAHIVFILGELINEHGFFGLSIHVSSIIATTVASLFLGNYSRHILSPKTDEYLGKFIEHIAFIANSLVFILAGLLFASSGIDVRSLWLPILVTVLVVAIVRIISVYAITIPLSKSKLEGEIPQSWQILLAWGSLRGALAIIIVLLIPEDFTVSGWNYAFSPQEFLLAITIGCILATLFIKAPLIGPLIRKLKIDTPEPLALAHEADLSIHYLMTEQERFELQKSKGFIALDHYTELKSRLDRKAREAFDERDSLRETYGATLFDQSLHLMAMRIESHTLKQLYINGEISERMMRKIKSKLNLQTEKIEYARHEDIDPSIYSDRKDIFDRFVNFMQTLFDRKGKQISTAETLQYYRAQMIMARKAVKIITDIQTAHTEKVFYDASFNRITSQYNRYKDQSGTKVDRMIADHHEELSDYLTYLAQKSLSASATRALDNLHSQGVVDEALEEEISQRWKVTT
jgi:CPA1 family monovalent cation:H+ antiporter